MSGVITFVVYNGRQVQARQQEIVEVYREAFRAPPYQKGEAEVAEIAVAPDFQRQGIGSRLHDGLIGSIPQRRAVLTTMTADTAASRLYRRRSWTVLLAGPYFPGANRPYSILGLDLRAPAGERKMRGSDGIV